MVIGDKSFLFKIWAWGRWSDTSSTNICTFFWTICLKVSLFPLVIWFYSLWWYFNAPEAKNYTIAIATFAVVIFVFWATIYTIGKLGKYGINSKAGQLTGEYLRAKKNKYCTIIEFE